MKMPLNNILPFFSTVIMAVFTISVLRRYMARRNPAFLYWGIGLGMFGAGSFGEAYLALAWSPVVFYIWYLFGAALNAGWIGHGTLHLLVKKRWVRLLSALLVVGSIITSILMLTTPLDASNFDPNIAISQQYRDIMPRGAPVRLTTPFFNVYGLVTLVGGALYSAFLFWRKRVLPNRVLGNVLIAIGALSIGFASSLARLGYGEYLYIGELIAAILMYGGFLMAAAPKAEISEMQVASTAVP
jgi:hypothetical protein